MPFDFFYCTFKIVKPLDKNNHNKKLYFMSETNFCSNCGAKLNPTDLFCQNCGTSIKKETEMKTNVTKEPEVQASVVTESPAPVAVATPPSQEEKNKLILLMVVSIIIPIVGIILGIIRYSKQDKKAGQHYLLCGLSGIAFAMGAWYWAGFLIGAVLIVSAIYTGLQNINKGEISSEI